LKEFRVGAKLLHHFSNHYAWFMFITNDRTHYAGKNTISIWKEERVLLKALLISLSHH